MQNPQELLRDLPGIEHLCRPSIPSETLMEWADRGLFFCTDVSVRQQLVGGVNGTKKVLAQFFATTCDRLVSDEPCVPVAKGALLANVRGGYYRDTLGRNLGVVSVLCASYDREETLWVGEDVSGDNGQPVLAGVLSMKGKAAELLKKDIAAANAMQMRVDRTPLSCDDESFGITAPGVGGYYRPEVHKEVPNIEARTCSWGVFTRLRT